MAKGKGVLDRKSLQGNGITFDLRVIGLNGLRNKLGEQAEKLAARLLGFHHRFVPQEKAEVIILELASFSSHFCERQIS